MRSSILSALAVVLTAGTGTPAELTPEALLPVHGAQDAYKPCAAFAGDAYLVAWQAGRTAPGDLRAGVKFSGDIVGCRVGKDGRPLDAKPFVICGATDLQEQPQAASNGKIFLVVWQDLRPSTSSGQATGRDWDVYAARVTTEGKVLDPNGFLVSGGQHNQALPRVVWDGRAFLVVWQDFRSGRFYEIFGAYVGTDGRVSEAQGIRIASQNGAHLYTPTVGSDGSGRSYVYWVARVAGLWGAGSSGGHLLEGGKVTPAYSWDPKSAGERTLLKTGPSGETNPLSMTFGGGDYLSAWQNWGSRAKNPLPEHNASLYDAGGKRIKTLNLGGANGGYAICPEVCWDGSAFVAAWDQVEQLSRPRQGKYNAAYVSRISAAGEVIGERQQLSGAFESPAHEACVASDGAGSSLIAYEKHPEKADTPIKIGFRIMTAK
jgi:hypothetical protein